MTATCVSKKCFYASVAVAPRLAPGGMAALAGGRCPTRLGAAGLGLQVCEGSIGLERGGSLTEAVVQLRSRS